MEYVAVNNDEEIQTQLAKATGSDRAVIVDVRVRYDRASQYVRGAASCLRADAVGSPGEVWFSAASGRACLFHPAVSKRGNREGQADADGQQSGLSAQADTVPNHQELVGHNGPGGIRGAEQGKA